ncbi:hypothetical protein JCM5353_006559 [Sporobolomyces roseus]
MSQSSNDLFTFPFSSRDPPAPPSWNSSSTSSSASSERSIASPATMELPTPPSLSMFDSEMDHLFHETIDTSFLDSRPSSPSAFSLPNLGNHPGFEIETLPIIPTSDYSPSLTLSLAPLSSSSSFRKNDVETNRQIDVLTTILTSPNLLPTSLPSLPIPARPRSLSSSSASSSRAKNQILGTTPPKSHKSWLDALKDAENKAKAKKLAGLQVTGLARL